MADKFYSMYQLSKLLSTKSEYIALADLVGEVAWVISVLVELKTKNQFYGVTTLVLSHFHLIQLWRLIPKNT